MMTDFEMISTFIMIIMLVISVVDICRKVK